MIISRRDTVVIDTNAVLWDELGHSGAECDIGQVRSLLDLGIAHSGQVEELGHGLSSGRGERAGLVGHLGHVGHSGQVEELVQVGHTGCIESFEHLGQVGQLGQSGQLGNPERVGLLEYSGQVEQF